MRSLAGYDDGECGLQSRQGARHPERFSELVPHPMAKPPWVAHGASSPLTTTHLELAVGRHGARAHHPTRCPAM
jgi:hypothetical protein